MVVQASPCATPLSFSPCKLPIHKILKLSQSCGKQVFQSPTHRQEGKCAVSQSFLGKISQVRKEVEGREVKSEENIVMSGKCFVSSRRGSSRNTFLRRLRALFFIHFFSYKSRYFFYTFNISLFSENLGTTFNI